MQVDGGLNDLNGFVHEAVWRFVGLYWNPWALVGMVSSVVAWALAALIYFTNPGRLQNRALALFIITMGTGFGVGVGWMFAAADVPTSLALQAVSLAGFYSSAPFYLLFLSTLPTRTMAWLRPRPVRVALWLAPIPIVLAMLFNFDRIVAGVIEVPYARFDSYWTRTGTLIFEAQAITTATLGIVAAVGAVRESPKGGLLHRQAKWYAATFVVWEVLQLVAFTLLEIAFRQANPSIALYTAAAGVIFPGAALLFMLMLAYSILKVQLFDIDLRIKIGLQRSFVAAPFAVAFFVATESLESLVPFDSYWMGLAAAGALSLAAVPLQRAATRMANALMPGVSDSLDYRDRRAREIYAAALGGALEDGAVSVTERDVLNRLGAELGLDAASMRALEGQAGIGVTA